MRESNEGAIEAKYLCVVSCLFLVHSDVIFANTNELYTEPVTGHARKNDVQHYKDLVKKDQDSLYDTVVDGVESNPAYDRSNFLRRNLFEKS